MTKDIQDLGPGTIVFTTTDEAGRTIEVSGPVKGFRLVVDRNEPVELDLMSEYYPTRLTQKYGLAGIYSMTETYSSEFDVDLSGAAFQYKITEPKEFAPEHFVKVEVADLSRDTIDAALDAIKAPKHAAITSGESEGSNYVVAVWTA